MKRIIAAVLLLCIAFFYCIFSYNILKEKSGEFYNLISECQLYITEGNNKQSEIKLKELSAFWNKNQKLYRILVDGNYCEIISESLALTKTSYSINEYSDAVQSLVDCKSALNHILEKEKPSFEAIL